MIVTVLVHGECLEIFPEGNDLDLVLRLYCIKKNFTNVDERDLDRLNGIIMASL